MVYISVIISHITNYNLSQVGPRWAAFHVLLNQLLIITYAILAFEKYSITCKGAKKNGSKKTKYYIPGNIICCIKRQEKMVT